ncbi:MAG: alpha/beta hydrolase, partial [Bacteroidota bacterium]
SAKATKSLADHLQLDSFGAIGYSRGSIVLARWLVEDQRINRAVLGGMGIDFIKPDWDRRIAFADAFSGRAELSELTRGAVEYAQSIDADLKVLGMLQDYQPVCSPEELQTIQIPVLVICGDQDVDNGDPQALQEALPNASLQIVEGDHNHTHQQENFAKAVTAFFSN